MKTLEYSVVNQPPLKMFIPLSCINKLKTATRFKKSLNVFWKNYNFLKDEFDFL